jgi:hypothetical protein
MCQRKGNKTKELLIHEALNVILSDDLFIWSTLSRMNIEDGRKQRKKVAIVKLFDFFLFSPKFKDIHSLFRTHPADEMNEMNERTKKKDLEMRL